MPRRWTLNRAGITNVYQYGDEVLHFGDGRLLLRGVNGSGKSTAMNMFLPFLLEADTRRIDAAGEQSGVLRSWMLSGRRDEPQPVGYLWIEFVRAAEHGSADSEPGSEYLVCGCGIRANQSTDRVTTWWFVTDRRPGVDLALVENNTPVSLDALRAEVGTGAVFTHEQRPAYRDEVRRRLYGGADLDQHLRLLHIVRSPRVGDRVDVDLPVYLEAALPQLSDAALADAAQPLEDLEEHRRNVEDLTRTVATLSALDAVYGNYGRTEIHGRLDAAEALLTRHRSFVRAHAELEAQQRTADDARAAATHAIAQLATDEARIAQEISTLEASDVYREGADLNELRERVTSLDRQVTVAEQGVARQAERRERERTSLERAQAQASDDVDVLRVHLEDLALVGVAAGLSVRPPDLPTIPTSSSIDDVPVPDEPFDITVIQRGLGEVRAAVGRRGDDVREVLTALGAVDRAVQALADAELSSQRAAAAEEKALNAFADARSARDEAVESWRDSLASWLAHVDQHHRAHGLPIVEHASLDDPTLADTSNEVHRSLHSTMQLTVDHHTAARERLAARRTTEVDAVTEAEATLAELLERTLPDPPRAAWQTDGAMAFAELVDFDPALDDATRARLEGALEAAGLLGAEVRSDGLVLADGQLVAQGAKPVENPLSAHLTAVVPEHVALPVEAVTAVLDAISTEPEDLVSADERTVITLDGQFRAGVLRGRHHKAEAEHIGVSARRAALERQRAAATDALAEAQRMLAATDADLTAAQRALDEAVTLRQSLPDDRAITAAVLAVQQAEQGLIDAREHVAACREELERREVAHAESVEASLRVARTLALPADRAELEQFQTTLRDVTSRCNGVENDAKALSRSVRAWTERGEALAGAVSDHAGSIRARDDLAAELAPVAIKLATLEDSIGLEYEEIVRAIATSKDDLASTRTCLDQSRKAELDAHGLAERLAADAENAAAATAGSEARCADALGTLRGSIEVPGLLASARISGEDPSQPDATDDRADDGGADSERAGDARATPGITLPAVAQTSDGLRMLTKALRAQVPLPDRSTTTADGVRQSLRQRRDALGAGWDAEDRQPDESLPVHIEVTGPLGGRMALRDATVAAQAQLRRMQGLLSAKQEAALSNLLKGLIAREVAEKLHAARDLVVLMNQRLAAVRTSHGIGVSLRWQRREDLDTNLLDTINLLAKPPDLRTADEDRALIAMLSTRIAEARQDDPEAPYRHLIAHVLDYREWHRMTLVLHRPGRPDERLTRRTALSEGEKKMVSYLPLFAAVAASCDALAEEAPSAPRFLLLDDAFAKVSEDNHPKLFGLLVELDLDFIATSERLWGTHSTVPHLAITEVLRDADLGIIVLEHSHWNGHHRERVP